MAQAAVNVALLYQAEICRGGGYRFFAQADIDNFPFADKLGVVGYEEADAGELYGQGQGGVYGVAVYNLRVPVAEHA